MSEFVYHRTFEPPTNLSGDTVIEFNIQGRDSRVPDYRRSYRDRVDAIDWGPRTGRRIVRYRIVTPA